MANNVTININAGTARYSRQLDEAKRKMQDTFGHGTTGQIQKVGAALRVVEGNMTNNIRAVERFLATIPGVGTAITAAFPVIGLIAFSGFLVEAGKRAYEFFLGLKEEPEKALGGFNKLSTSLALVDDQLKVSNAQLETEIAKLSGRPGDGLKVALLEAKGAADKLKEALGGDLEALYKLIGEQRGGTFTQFMDWFNVKGNLKDFQRGLGGLTGAGGANADIQKTMDEGIEKISKAKDLDASRLAQQELLNTVTAKYNSLLDAANAKKAEFTRREAGYEYKRGSDGSYQLSTLGHLFGGGGAVKGVDEAANLENINKDIALLQKQKEIAADTIRNAQLVQQKTELETEKNNRRLERPADKMLAEMNAELTAARTKLSAIGGDPAMEVVASGAAEAFKKLAVLNEELKKNNEHMTVATYMDVLSLAVLTAQTNAETAWKKKLEETNGELDARIARQRQINALNEGNYAARRDIAVETEVRGKFGKDLDDPDKAAAIEAERGKIRQAFDLEHQHQLDLQSRELSAQVSLYTQLIAVAGDFSKTHQAQLNAEVEKMRAEGRYTEEQIDQFRRLNALKLEAESATRAAADRLAVQNIQRTQGAAFGSEGVRQQVEIQNALYEAAAKGATVQEQKALAAKLEAEYHAKIIEDAGKLATADSARLETLNKQIAAMQAQILLNGGNLEIQHALKALEDQRLDVAIKMQLESESAYAGVKAFFLEMQKQAETASKMIYDTLNETLNKTTDNLAKMMTEKSPKGGWGRMWGQTFEGIGEDLSRSAIHGTLQRGLGVLGSHIPGLDKALGIGKPDGTAEHPWHVIVDGGGAASGNAVPNPLGGILNRKGGVFGAGDLGGGVFSLLDTATGGSADSGDRESSGGGNTYHYTIYAPGAQVGVEGRIAQAIEAAHNAAVRNSVLVSKQQQVRMPQISGGMGGSF